MHRLRVICICIVVINAHGPLRAQEPQTDKVTIKGQTYTLYPPEKLRAKGANIQDVPRDQNAAYVYIDAINAVKPMREGNDLVDAENSAYGGIWPEGEPGEYFAKWLAENKVALDLARQAAAMPAYSRPLYKGDSDSIVSVLLPDLAANRQLAKMLVMEGTLLANQGNADAAMQNFLAAQKMGSHFAHGCTLIEGLMGIAVQSLSAKAISHLIESGKVSPELIKSSIEQMDRITAMYPPVEDYLNRERFFSAAIIDDMMESPSWAFDLNSCAPPADMQSGWYKLATALKRVYLPDRAMKRHLKQYFDDVNEDIRSGRGTIEEGRIFGKIPVWSFPARMLLPSLSRVYELTLRSQCNVERTKVGAAVEAFRQRHGALPNTLAGLVPEYLPAVPVDPMTNVEMEYSPGADGKPVGVEQVSSKNEEAIRAKRLKPVIVNARASEWQRYVIAFKRDYKLSESQAAAVDGILRSLEAQAISYEVTHGESIQKLQAMGNTAELARETAPIDQIFEELKKRLDIVPDARQRSEVKKAEPRS
jgi:hypothetical protein